MVKVQILVVGIIGEGHFKVERTLLVASTEDMMREVGEISGKVIPGMDIMGKNTDMDIAVDKNTNMDITTVANVDVIMMDIITIIEMIGLVHQTVMDDTEMIVEIDLIEVAVIDEF